MSTYTPKQLLAAVRERPAPDSFFRSKLVTGKPIISDKKFIEVDKYTQGQGVAVYNSRTGGPTSVKKTDFTTDTHVSPYVFEEITMTPSDVDSREVGETIYESDAVRNASNKGIEYLEQLNGRIDRLEEKQIVEAVTSGTVTVSNATTGVNYTVDYGLDSDNKDTLTGDDVWGGTNSDISGNLEDYASRLAKKGYVATDIVLDFYAAQKFKADTAILALLDNRSVMVGEIDIRRVAGQRASYIGTLVGIGFNVKVWCYFGGYETADDTFSYYMDSNRMIMVGAGVQIQQHYGKIENFKANFKGRRFPMQVEDKYGKFKQLTMESAPLAVLRNPNAIFSAKVGA